MPLERLIGEDLGAVLGSEPKPPLLFGNDSAGEDGVDADIVFTDFVSQGAGEADDGSFGGGAGLHAATNLEGNAYSDFRKAFAQAWR